MSLDFKITKEEIDYAFKGSCFGPEVQTHEARVKILAESVFKVACRYTVGSTMAAILVKLNLAYESPAGFRHIDDGLRWAYGIYNP